MQPTAAEIARTLARGHLEATAHIACRPGPLPVRHATDCVGRPLLLVRTGDPVAGALSPRPGARDVAVVVSATDRPPVPGAPSLGRVWVSGWAARVDGDIPRRDAAIEFAETSPIDDLLDVGRGLELYQVDVKEVRLETSGTLRPVDPEEYTAADPDPLHELEVDLLADLADHHAEQIRPYLARRLSDAGVPARTGYVPQVVRLDRYGFLVAPYAPARSAAVAPAAGGGGQFIRLPFPRPVRDRVDLARLLHPVLFPQGCQHHAGQ